MRFAFILFACLILVNTTAYTQGVEDFCVKVEAQVSTNPIAIQLKWVNIPGNTQYTIFRKLKTDNTWTTTPIATLNGEIVNYIDTNIEVGVGYEYKIVRNFNISNNNYTGYGYIYAGIELEAIENMGKVIVVIDTLTTHQLPNELKLYLADLYGAGWQPETLAVSPTTPVSEIQEEIRYRYDAEPNQYSAVVLLGRVPVPYSGNFAPDAHPDHVGAWPADTYYGEMNGTWTDFVVNNSGATRAENRNIPGDGKFDSSTLPSLIELPVGRIDFSKFPSISTSSIELTKRYISKNHDFRFKNFVLPPRALVDDNFGLYGSTNTAPFAATAWRNFSAFFGSDSVKSLDWFGTLENTPYLCAYGCGGGSYTSAAGVGSTQDFININCQTVFSFLFGSYFGDWDIEDNFLRAPLATSAYTLTSAWAGRPYFPLHHFALGEPLSYALKLSQNYNATLYETGYFPRSVHIALMGDPTLTLFNVSPANNLIAIPSIDGQSINLSWEAAQENNLKGYHIYRYNPLEKNYQRINASPIVSTSFVDPQPLVGDNIYMVRALALITSASGSYYQLSQGIFDTLNIQPTLLVNNVTPTSVCLGDTVLFNIETWGPFQTNNQFIVEVWDNATQAWVIQANITATQISNIFLSTTGFIAGNNVLRVRATSPALVSEQINIFVYSIPQVPVIQVSNDTLFVMSVPNYTYHWYKNGTLLNQNSSLLVNPQPGTYTVTVIDENGCSSHSEEYLYEGLNRTVVLGSNLDINIYVDNNLLFIKSNSLLEATKLRLFNVQGQILMEEVLILPNEISIEKFPVGLYIATIQSNDKLYYKRLIKW